MRAMIGGVRVYLNEDCGLMLLLLVVGNGNFEVDIVGL